MSDNGVRRFGMYLELVENGDDRILQCRECNEQICSVDSDDYNDWRDHVPVYESRVADRMVNELDMWVSDREETDEAVMIEYYCPNCAVRIHSQTTLDSEKQPLQAAPEFLSS
jgi:acetone carboxylase gamma subunit